MKKLILLLAIIISSPCQASEGDKKETKKSAPVMTDSPQRDALNRLATELARDTLHYNIYMRSCTQLKKEVELQPITEETLKEAINREWEGCERNPYNSYAQKKAHLLEKTLENLKKKNADQRNKLTDHTKKTLEYLQRCQTATTTMFRTINSLDIEERTIPQDTMLNGLKGDYAFLIGKQHVDSYEEAEKVFRGLTE